MTRTTKSPHTKPDVWSTRVRIDLSVRPSDRHVWREAEQQAAKRRQSLSAYVAAVLEEYQRAQDEP